MASRSENDSEDPSARMKLCPDEGSELVSRDFAQLLMASGVLRRPIFILPLKPLKSLSDSQSSFESLV